MTCAACLTLVALWVLLDAWAAAAAEWVAGSGGAGR